MKCLRENLRFNIYKMYIKFEMVHLIQSINQFRNQSVSIK